MNYGELKTAIQNYCQNSEASFVAHIDDFVRSAEDKIFMAVEMPAFRKSDSTLVTADGVSGLTLPAGAIDISSVRVGEAPAAVGVVEDGPVRYLLQKDHSFLLEAYPGTDSAHTKGIPKYYAISSAGDALGVSDPELTIRLGPIPDAVYPVTVDYYGKTAAESITNGGITGNETWISVTAPSALLYGSLVEAYTYMKGEPDMVQSYLQMFQTELVLLKNLSENRLTSNSTRVSPVTVAQ